MLTLDTKKKAIALIALMMVSALAGCLGNDDDDTDDSSNTNNNTDTGDNTTTPVDTGIDVGTVTCGPDGSIKIAGSSTVLPLAEIWAEYYQENCEGVTITVESGGSGGGAGRVCANSAKGTPVDIGDMSRDWKDTEATRGDDGYTMDCLAGDTSRSARQIQVAIDGLSVVMKKGGAADVCVN
ncbi:MAG: substrate-binding domain-containing protein, partial [Candidatus Poseidoniaceae archaeon]